MKTLHVTRYATGPGGTRSYVWLPGQTKVYHGLEQPWRENKPFASCIPEGAYALLPWDSPKYGSCLILIGGTVAESAADLTETVKRYACLMHPANYARQLQGCLAIGLDLADDGDRETGHPAVWSSRRALEALMASLGGTPAQAIFTWTCEATVPDTGA